MRAPVANPANKTTTNRRTGVLPLRLLAVRTAIQKNVVFITIYQPRPVIPAFTLCRTRYVSVYLIHFAVVFVLSIIVAYI